MKSLISKLLNRPITLSPKWNQTLVKEIRFVSVDLELTSLDTKVSKVTSAGWVQGFEQQIDINTCHHHIIRAAGDLHQSPVIHGLTEKDLAKGVHIKDVLIQLMPMASSHLWVLHNANLDLSILKRISVELNLPKTTLLAIDTMQLELYLQKKADQAIKPDSVTLENCRSRHKLPKVPCHNALDDAVATLQLLFSQLYILNKTQSLVINDLLHTNAINQFELGVEKEHFVS